MKECINEVIAGAYIKRRSCAANVPLTAATVARCAKMNTMVLILAILTTKKIINHKKNEIMDSLYEALAFMNPNMNPFTMRCAPVHIVDTDYEEVKETEEVKEIDEYTSKL